MLRPLILCVCFLPLASAQAQSDWYVDAGGVPPGTGTVQDPYTSIQYAIEQQGTQDGDRLLVASGTYAESVDFLGKDLLVRHNGFGAQPILTGDGVVSTVRFVSGESSAAQLVNFVVSGELPLFPPTSAGGGILVDGATPVLSNVIVRDSRATRGGGIALLNGALTLKSCSVQDNQSQEGGGGIHVASGLLTMEGGQVIDNEVEGSGGNGGGIEALAGGSLLLSDTLVMGNLLLFARGGGIYADGAASLERVTIRQNCRTFMSNPCSAGAGIYAPNAVGNDCEILSNGALVTFNGGGASGGAWTNTLFAFNDASQHGGGLDMGWAQDCQFLDNSLYNEGDVPSGPGAGAARSTLIDCLVQGNRSEENGGGTAFCDLVRCTVRWNTAGFDEIGQGAGVYEGSATDCLIEFNYLRGLSGVAGGGAGSADLLRCIVRGNSAPRAGGVWKGSVNQCTIVHNYAQGLQGDFGGGVLQSSVSNSIVWGNAPDQVMDTMVTYSNIQDGAAGVGNINSDPRFFGPGSDLYLLGDSPCIDAGDPMAPLDADGSRADMGAQAFEMFHRREDAPFCLGQKELVVDGELSLSGPVRTLTCENAKLYLISAQAGYEPTIFQSSFFQRPSALCLVGSVLRLPPTAMAQLELGPTQLTQLGLLPGDRVLVQAFGQGSGGVFLSNGLDLLVRP